MPDRCTAAGCDNIPVQSADWEKAVTLFTFPSDKVLLQKWVTNITLKRPASELTSRSKLCSKHFDDDSFENKDTYILKQRLNLKPPR